MDESIEHQMTEIYCFVDDFLTARPALSGWRSSPHRSPRFTDAEVITIALLQGPLGVASLVRVLKPRRAVSDSVRTTIHTPVPLTSSCNV